MQPAALARAFLESQGCQAAQPTTSCPAWRHAPDSSGLPADDAVRAEGLFPWEKASTRPNRYTARGRTRSGRRGSLSVRRRQVHFHGRHWPAWPPGNTRAHGHMRLVRICVAKPRSRGRRSSRTDSAPVCGDYINAFSTVPGAFPRGAGGVVVQRCLGGLGHAQEPLHFLGPHALSAWRSPCNADAESMAPEAGAPAPPLLLPSAAPARTPRRRPLGAHVTATPVGTGRERRVTPGRRPCASAGCSRASAAAHFVSNEPA
ncbi:hypothetical protein HPB50_021092 [Hyalomma asiaticum]|uniref:Uncharacterized protein n=1 Tax=Hyalomma asiaticum TaxID=266040 RepID=A0ACB7TNY5_HYAAI|nr:hypothetical protein HPB50_021092 [Hyalomma asiaticum]